MKRSGVVCILIAVLAFAGLARGEGTNPAPTSTTPIPVIKVEPSGQTNSPAATGTPRLAFDKTVYDFGTTSQVTAVTGTFTFHNAGNGLLEIKKPQPSCGCTVASVKPESLKPGEKGELVFTVNIGNIHADIEKHITVPSNDPQLPNGNVNLTIKAKVVALFEANPMQLMLGVLQAGTTTNIPIHVKRTDGKPLVLSKAEANIPWIHPTIKDSGGQSETVVDVTTSPEGQPHQFSYQIKIFAENTNQPAITIPISGRLVGELTVNPEAIFWGIIDGSAWATAKPEDRIRRIRVSYDKPSGTMTVTNLTSSLKDVTLKVETVETGKVYEVVAELPEAPKETERGTISFDTSVASQPNVNIPVYVNVLKATRAAAQR